LKNDLCHLFFIYVTEIIIASYKLLMAETISSIYQIDR